MCHVSVTLESLGYFSAAESMGLASASMTLLAESTAFGEKHHRMAITLFKVNQGQRFLVPIESLCATFY